MSELKRPHEIEWLTAFSHQHRPKEVREMALKKLAIPSSSDFSGLPPSFRPHAPDVIRVILAEYFVRKHEWDLTPPEIVPFERDHKLLKGPYKRYLEETLDAVASLQGCLEHPNEFFRQQLAADLDQARKSIPLFTREELPDWNLGRLRILANELRLALESVPTPTRGGGPYSRHAERWATNALGWVWDTVRHLPDSAEMTDRAKSQFVPSTIVETLAANGVDVTLDTTATMDPPGVHGDELGKLQLFVQEHLPIPPSELATLMAKFWSSDLTDRQTGPS